MKHILLAVVALITLLPAACTGARAVNTVNKRHVRYGIALLPDTWQKQSFRGADLFFHHKNKDAMIFLSSQCDKFSDSPLEALTSQILVGMGKYDIISEKRLNLSEREALISEVNVKLDGVDRYLKIMVLRKNRCIFDAVLSAKIYSKEIVDDFDNMITTFWAEADL